MIAGLPIDGESLTSSSAGASRTSIVSFCCKSCPLILRPHVRSARDTKNFLRPPSPSVIHAGTGARAAGRRSVLSVCLRTHTGHARAVSVSRRGEGAMEVPLLGASAMADQHATVIEHKKTIAAFVRPSSIVSRDRNISKVRYNRARLSRG